MRRIETASDIKSATGQLARVTGGDRALRVHVVISSLTWGGAEALLSDFAEGATAAGIEVTVSYLSEDARGVGRLHALGIAPASVPITSLLDPGDWRRVRDHIAGIAPDLVHTHLGNADLLGGMAARRLGIPTVATIHLADPRGDWVRERVKTRLMAAARRHCAARVITVSEAGRRGYLESGWDHPDRVVAVHNGIVDRAETGAGRRIRAELGLGPEDVVIAMISVLRRDKGHRLAVEAVERLLPSHSNLRLLIIGEGPDRDHVERVAARLSSSVIFTGHRTDVMRTLDAVDVLVHPSVRDAFPTTLLEAAAAGVPAIATAVEGIPEIIENGLTGLLIPAPPTAEALIGALGPLMADPSRRMRLARAARERFEREFTVERWLARLLPVYETALAEGGVNLAVQKPIAPIEPPLDTGAA